MPKFICLVEGRSLPNNPRIHTTRESASQEALRLATMERKTTYVAEVLEIYEVSIKETYRKAEVPPSPTLKDGDEGVFHDSRNRNEYKTLIIGNQEWMNENLNYGYDPSLYRSNHKWSSKDEGLYSPTEDARNGYLYQWSAAMKCAEGLPDGWRLPTKEDFEKAKLGANPKWNRTYAGYRRGDSVGTFYRHNSFEVLWSSSTSSASDAWVEDFNTSNRSSSSRGNNTKTFGFSVRLVRDIS